MTRIATFYIIFPLLIVMACEQSCPSEIDQRASQISEQLEFDSQPEGAEWSLKFLPSRSLIDSLAQNISNEYNAPKNSGPVSGLKNVADSLFRNLAESQELWWYDYSDQSYIERGFVISENCKVQEKLAIGSN